MILDSSQWKEIPGFTNYYASIDGKIVSGPRWHRPNWNVLKPCECLQYSTVALDGKTQYVHRLVLLTFGGPPTSGQEVNHKDGDKRNNAIDNLEWVTRSENMQHAVANGLFSLPCGIHVGMRNPNAKLTAKDVGDIRAAKGKVTVHDIIFSYGISRTQVYRLWRGEQWADLK
jgi:hypothetical protein